MKFLLLVFLLLNCAGVHIGIQMYELAITVTSMPGKLNAAVFRPLIRHDVDEKFLEESSTLDCRTLLSQSWGADAPSP